MCKALIRVWPGVSGLSANEGVVIVGSTAPGGFIRCDERVAHLLQVHTFDQHPDQAGVGPLERRNVEPDAEGIDPSAKLADVDRAESR